MSQPVLAAHQAALFILAALAVTAFGAVEPWSRPLLCIGAALFAVSMVSRVRRDNPPWTLLAPCLIAVVLGAFSICMPTNALGPSSLLPQTVSVARTREAIAQFIIVILALWCGATIFRGREGLRRAASGLLGVAGFLTVMALVQRAGGNLMLLGVRSYTWGNPFGPILNYNHAADILLLAIPIAIARSIEPPNTKLDATEYWARRLVLACGVLFLLSGLMISSSRGAAVFLALALGIWALSWARGLQRWILVFGAVLLPILVLYRNAVFNPARATFLDDSTSIRIAMWRGGLALLRDQPLFGVGPGGVLTAFEPYRPSWIKFIIDRVHSEPLEIFLEYGLIGGGLVFISLFRTIASSYSGWQRAEPSTREIVLPFVVGIAAVAAHQLVEFSLRIPAVSFLLAVSCGVVWGALAKPTESLRERNLIYSWILVFGCCSFAFIEGIPTSIAGGYEAFYRYDSGLRRRRETLEQALRLRNDADLHLQYSLSIDDHDGRETLLRVLGHASDAVNLEPGEIRHRRSAGAILLRLGRTRDGAYLGGRG